jgi:hypothetical protein
VNVTRFPPRAAPPARGPAALEPSGFYLSGEKVDNGARSGILQLQSPPNGSTWDRQVRSVPHSHRAMAWASSPATGGTTKVMA